MKHLLFSVLMVVGAIVALSAPTPASAQENPAARFMCGGIDACAQIAQLATNNADLATRIAAMEAAARRVEGSPQLAPALRTMMVREEASETSVRTETGTAGREPAVAARSARSVLRSGSRGFAEPPPAPAAAVASRPAASSPRPTVSHRRRNRVPIVSRDEPSSSLPEPPAPATPEACAPNDAECCNRNGGLMFDAHGDGAGEGTVCHTGRDLFSSLLTRIEDTDSWAVGTAGRLTEAVNRLPALIEERTICVFLAANSAAGLRAPPGYHCDTVDARLAAAQVAAAQLPPDPHPVTR